MPNNPDPMLVILDSRNHPNQPFAPGDRVRFTARYGTAPPLTIEYTNIRDGAARRRDNARFFERVFTVARCVRSHVQGGWTVYLEQEELELPPGGFSCDWFEVVAGENAEAGDANNT